MVTAARLLLLSLAPIFATLATACALPLEEPELVEAVAQPVTIPTRGGATTLDIASWNIEWFGDPSNGPGNDTLQLQNARDVIAGTDFDIWGFAEIVGVTQWNSLKSQLPGYAGFLANESNVVGGSTYYGTTEQKVGILYKSALATLLDARVILTANDSDFAGRPPLQVTLRVSLNDTTEDIVVIVMHPKCCSDTSSWQRRLTAANALKAYLDATYPTQKVWVVGDFNDDVDTSITAGKPSPYAGFVTDTARYRFPTQALSLAGIPSTVSFSDTIDHHLNTNEASALYVPDSVAVYRVDQYITNYGSTTSDHYPVLSRYAWGTGGGGGGGDPAAVTLTSLVDAENLRGGTIQPITWTETGITAVKLEYTTDDGATWTLITSSTPAAAGSYAWTVPAVNSDRCRVRITDTASAASFTSDPPFTIRSAVTAPRVVLNEILATEPGSDVAAEAIELVNLGTATADLSGWTLSDAVSARHQFAVGTTLAPGKAIVVFGGPTGIPAGLANAVAASTGQLNLSNSGDTVTLKDASGATKDSFTYDSTLSGTDGVSMNRGPDGSTGAFALHTALSSLLASPGTRATGAAW